MKCDYGSILRDAILALKMEKGAGAKERRWPLGTAKDKEMDSPLESPEGMWPCLILAQ